MKKNPRAQVDQNLHQIDNTQTRHPDEKFRTLTQFQQNQRISNSQTARTGEDQHPSVPGEISAIGGLKLQAST